MASAAAAADRCRRLALAARGLVCGQRAGEIRSCLDARLSQRLCRQRRVMLGGRMLRADDVRALIWYRWYRSRQKRRAPVSMSTSAASSSRERPECRAGARNAKHLALGRRWVPMLRSRYEPVCASRRSLELSSQPTLKREGRRSRRSCDRSHHPHSFCPHHRGFGGCSESARSMQRLRHDMIRYRG